MPYLDIFGLEFFKKLFSYLKSSPLHSIIANFCEETKMPKFGTKSAIFSIFDQECLNWVFLG